jgi:hypothetical protein
MMIRSDADLQSKGTPHLDCRLGSSSDSSKLQYGSSEMLYELPMIYLQHTNTPSKLAVAIYMHSACWL